MAQTPYTVYYAIDSLCSYMLRYALAVRGPGKNGQEISISDRVVDIHYERDHLSEFYLLEVNPKGEVRLTYRGLTSPSCCTLLDMGEAFEKSER